MMAFRCAENNVAAFAPISSVGATFRYKLFTTEAHATAPSVTGLDINFRFVDKLHDRPFR